MNDDNNKKYKKPETGYASGSKSFEALKVMCHLSKDLKNEGPHM